MENSVEVDANAAGEALIGGGSGVDDPFHIQSYSYLCIYMIYLYTDTWIYISI